MQFNIRHSPFYNFLTILRSSARVPFFYSSGPCTVPAKFFPAFLLISFVSAAFYFKERYVTLYLYYICRVFPAGSAGCFVFSGGSPGCTVQDVCCFPVCFCRSCKKFSQDSPFQRSATGCPANYKKKVLLN